MIAVRARMFTAARAIKDLSNKYTHYTEDGSASVFGTSGFGASSHFMAEESPFPNIVQQRFGETC